MKGSGTTIKDFFEFAYEYHKNKNIHILIRKLEQRIYENYKNKLFNKQKFKELIKDLYFDQKGWYSWTGLKYLLYEYELYLQLENKGETKLQWEEINKDSFEHVFPQNSERSCWYELNTLEKEGRHKVLHSLGNLVLLSKSHNSKLGNKCFTEKKEVFSTASFSTIEISKNEYWTKENILNRENKILKFMSNRWNLLLSDENEIYQITEESILEDSYSRVVEHDENDKVSLRGNKKKALLYLQENTEYLLNNQNMVFSNMNKTSGEWWFEPSNVKFKSELFIVLYHNIEKILYMFHLPANSINNPLIQLYQRKNGKPTITISPNNTEFMDTKKGLISLKKYLVGKFNIATEEMD